MAHDLSREYLIDNRHNNSRRQNEQAQNEQAILQNVTPVAAGTDPRHAPIISHGVAAWRY
jgi:hypothetical protein